MGIMLESSTWCLITRLHSNEEYIMNRVYGRYGNEIMNNGCKEWMEWRKYSRVVVGIVVGIGWGGEAATTAVLGMYWPAFREVINHPGKWKLEQQVDEASIHLYPPPFLWRTCAPESSFCVTNCICRLSIWREAIPSNLHSSSQPWRPWTNNKYYLILFCSAHRRPLTLDLTSYRTSPQCITSFTSNIRIQQIRITITALQAAAPQSISTGPQKYRLISFPLLSLSSSRFISFDWQFIFPVGIRIEHRERHIIPIRKQYQRQNNAGRR